jgi:hypothetical protein
VFAWAYAVANPFDLIYLRVVGEDELLTNHPTNGEAVVTVVVVLPIHITIVEVQVVGVLNITAVE